MTSSEFYTSFTKQESSDRTGRPDFWRAAGRTDPGLILTDLL